LDSREDAMKIKMYVEYGYQDHHFEEMNIIWSLFWRDEINIVGERTCMSPREGEYAIYNFCDRLEQMGIKLTFNLSSTQNLNEVGLPMCTNNLR
jgi:hypothetical protein